MSFTSFVLFFQMCKSEDEHSAVVCDGHGDLSDMTGASESILDLLQQGDPEPVRKCPP